MNPIASDLSTWSFPHDGTAHDAAGALVAHLRAAGREASRVEDDDVDLVRTGTGTILLHTGEPQAIREAVQKVQARPHLGALHHVVASRPLPSDIVAAYGDTPLARCERRLAECGALSLLRPLSDLPEQVAEVGEVVAEVLGVELDPAGGLDTLRAIDALVHAHRPTEVDEASVFPLHVLMGLGLVAVRTVQLLAGDDGQLVHRDSAKSRVHSLADAGGFPALALAEGALVLAVAHKPLKAWYSGEDSLFDLWGAAQSHLKGATAGSVDEEAVAKVLFAAGYAGTQTALYLCNLDDGTECSPTMWTYDGVKVSMGYLMAASSGHADFMADAELAKRGTELESAATVVDQYMTLPGRERSDTLVVRIVLPGSPIDVRIAVPYMPSSAGLAFSHAPFVVQKRGVEIEDAALEQAFFATLKGMSQPVIERIPDAFDSLVDVVVAGAAPGAEIPARIRRLASIAPYAAFLIVALADGELEPSEGQAFATGLHRCEDPALQELLGSGLVDVQKVLGSLATDPDLVRRTLAAAGVWFAHHPSGEAGREALLDVLRQVAGAGGESRSEEDAAVLRVGAAMRAGEEVALSGTEPEGLFLDALEADFDAAAFAPWAAMMMVVAADGELEPREMEAFRDACEAVTNPLLLALLQAGAQEADRQMEALRDDPMLLPTTFAAAGRLFAAHPVGPEAREQLMETLRATASVHGALRSQEREALRAIEAALDGEEVTGGLWWFRGVLLSVLVAVVVGAWLLVAVPLGVPGALPVAVGLQVLVMGAVLVAMRTRGFLVRVLTGFTGGVCAAAAVGLWSTMLGLVFGGAPAGLSVLGAMAGAGVLVSIAVPVWSALRR